MGCFAEQSVLRARTTISSGSGVFSPWATTDYRCFKPRAAPGDGTAPACANASSASLRKLQRLGPGFKFSLVETHGLLPALQLREINPAWKEPRSRCSITATRGMSLDVRLDGTDAQQMTEAGLSIN